MSRTVPGLWKPTVTRQREPHMQPQSLEPVRWQQLLHTWRQPTQSFIQNRCTNVGKESTGDRQRHMQSLKALACSRVAPEYGKSPAATEDGPSSPRRRLLWQNEVSRKQRRSQMLQLGLSPSPNPNWTCLWQYSWKWKVCQGQYMDHLQKHFPPFDPELQNKRLAHSTYVTVDFTSH